LLGCIASSYHTLHPRKLSPEQQIAIQLIRQNNAKHRDLIHRRLGHLSLSRLQFMINHRTSADLDPIEFTADDFHCEGCTKGSKNRANFDSNPGRDFLNIESLHFDVVHLTPTVHTKFEYALVSVCENSRYSWIAFLERKDEALVHAIRLIERLEPEFDTKVKNIRFDNGELDSTAFHTYCSSKGIVITPSTRKTPEFDGIAERHIQTLVNMARTLLQQCGNLSSDYWTYAMKHANDIKNRLPIIARGILSPFESLYGTSPFINHFRVFGSGCLYHLERSDRKKLNAKAAPAIYIGAVSRSIVKLLDTHSGKLLYRRIRDVVFNESAFPPLEIESNNNSFDFDHTFLNSISSAKITDPLIE
jgi:hypothetical protein